MANQNQQGDLTGTIICYMNQIFKDRSLSKKKKVLTLLLYQ